MAAQARKRRSSGRKRGPVPRKTTRRRTTRRGTLRRRVTRRRPAPKPRHTGKFRHGLNKEVSVMAWIENPFGEILMVRQAKGQRRWALPGGKVERFESLMHAVKREVKEETGLRVQEARPVAFYDRFSSGNVTILFRVRLKKQWIPRRLRPTEEILGMEFKMDLPSKPTPSARHFWNVVYPPLPPPV
jgi:ADP-ribose pyrophosphatase YjhB (NUDIX family)